MGAALGPSRNSGVETACGGQDSLKTNASDLLGDLEWSDTCRIGVPQNGDGGRQKNSWIMAAVFPDVRYISTQICEAQQRPVDQPSEPKGGRPLLVSPRARCLVVALEGRANHGSSFTRCKGLRTPAKGIDCHTA